ncbi:hypothetical protein D6C82_05610 [Aureobasidium pullulans]|nr:hypothetical protein D6C82_05610 [Aureobasidium pullulans]
MVACPRYDQSQSKLHFDYAGMGAFVYLLVEAESSNFVQDKFEQLTHDLKQSSQTLAPEHVKSSQLWPSTLQKDGGTVSTEFENNKDKALDAIINGFSPKTVKEDIAKLVFLWVDVQEFADFKRDDVMKTL